MKILIARETLLLIWLSAFSSSGSRMASRDENQSNRDVYLSLSLSIVDAEEEEEEKKKRR
jgi:hypothetical protein